MTTSMKIVYLKLQIKTAQTKKINFKLYFSQAINLYCNNVCKLFIFFHPLQYIFTTYSLKFKLYYKI